MLHNEQIAPVIATNLARSAAIRNTDAYCVIATQVKIGFGM